MAQIVRPLWLLAALGLLGGCATGMGGADSAQAGRAAMKEKLQEAVPITEVIGAAKEHVDGRVNAAVFFPAANRYVVRMVDNKDQCWRLDFAAETGDMIKAGPAREAKEYTDPCAPYGQRNPEGFPAW
jgi:hypothetical protein